MIEFIGKNIQKIRKNRGLTQQQLARSIRVSQGVITRLENGHTMVSVDKLIRIAETLDVPIEALFVYDNESEPINKELYFYILQLNDKSKKFLLDILKIYFQCNKTM